MTTQGCSQCDVCVHRRDQRTLEEFVAGAPSPNLCDAFPEGIPPAILVNEVDHRQPVEGDHGIRWTAQPGQDYPQYALDVVAKQRAWQAARTSTTLRNRRSGPSHRSVPFACPRDAGQHRRGPRRPS